jgi:hypothetical protein
MQLRLRSGRLAFQKLLNKMNAPTRTVTFITQHLIGGARGLAKPTMHASPDQRGRLLRFDVIL